MKATILIKVIIGLLMLVATFEANAETRKFAVVLGNNLGHDPAKELSYAEQDAIKIHNVLTELGGFAPGDVEMVLNGNADRAWAAIHGLEKRIIENKKKTGSKALLLFYYSGHAEGDVLELGKTYLRFGQLLDFLQSSAADVRLAFLDSCQSGRLIAAKGGHRGPEYQINITDEMTSNGYAIITSSAHNELSQESVEIRGAFFTHYLVSALRGAADKSQDGKVTLAEAYQYAYAQTLARTSATIGSRQHPMYEFKLQGRGEIVLTKIGNTTTHISTVLPEAGRLLILDASENTIVAEAEISSGNRAFFAVRPGRYEAYLLTKIDTVRVAKVDALQEGSVHLNADDFQTIELEEAVPKGGLFIKAKTHMTHRLGSGGLWRKWSLEDAFSSYGASLQYRVEIPNQLEPSIRLTWTTRPDVGISAGYHDVGAAIGIGYVVPVSLVILRPQVFVGYEQLFQANRSGKKRTTPGFSYIGILGAELPLGHRFFTSLDVAGGGRFFEVLDKGIVHRFDLQVVLSLGLKWIAKVGGQK
ncbi:MAG: caspase family protein [Myxococcota bacterium]|nr:caspase family protein [Myxococcota bacterium]